ncbi:DUF2388 domain-containing protein [Pseudomonas chlororaphis]|uniref:DUF2388 domain-containing protein n=1 Tax=Pseudomonas chlororaphis TaxID=587753 RepID=UPI00209B445E|nr:DUF2388 domain-containing protein [Pseudomonas chlororaphis]MCO7573682.1 DUF2388 domain-containing protein [Pseudomonas chlororaphis]MCO7592086.1 DUF2388 domain-containing protein [Pseudomonas chlororaphis]MCO7613441.1 DUF2388 domain-containing protein [Pseudomonas chlororaphis]
MFAEDSLPMPIRHRYRHCLLCIALYSSAGNTTSLVISSDLSMSGLLTTRERTAKISSSPRDDKQVLEARSGAAAFVASDRTLDSMQFKSALKRLRRMLYNPRYSDEQLAPAVLTL